MCKEKEIEDELEDLLGINVSVDENKNIYFINLKLSFHFSFIDMFFRIYLKNY